MTNSYKAYISRQNAWFTHTHIIDFIGDWILFNSNSIIVLEHLFEYITAGCILKETFRQGLQA